MAALVVCIVLIVVMAWKLQREFEAVSSANSDNVEWFLSQSKVEFTQFRMAVLRAQTGTDGLDDLRRRFDVFYSRMDTLDSARAFRAMRDDTAFARPYARIDGFLDGLVPLIDGPDSDLRAALPDISARAAETNDDLIDMSLAALHNFVVSADERRHELIRLISTMAIVLTALFAALGLLALSLLRVAGLAEDRARQIEEKTQRLRTIFDTSLDAIVLTDSEGRIREVNPAAAQLFGHCPDAVLGRSAVGVLVAEQDRARLTGQSGLDVIRSLQDRRFEVDVVDADNRQFPVEVSLGWTASNEPLFVACIRDISARRAAEEALTDARDKALAGERAKSEFLAVMSHEMRTPLNGLLGSLQLLRDRLPPDQCNDLLDRMQNSGMLLLALVNDVLDLAKFEAGKMTADTAPFDLPDLLDGVVATLAPLAAAQGNELSWTRAADTPHTVLGDAQRLRQVLLNLVGNAIKFTRDGMVAIEIDTVHGQADMVELRVIDTGIGIAETDLSRIFQDFETLDSSYARSAGGTGLGLGIARRMAALMGGEIGAESEPGEGSLFWVRLPLPPATGKAPAPATPHPPQTGAVARDILLVEDNEINRYVARSMLESAGHRVTEAPDGAAGVAAADTHRYDLILMDISMPGMDGMQATQRIRGGSGASRDTPIVAVTAHVLPREVQRFGDLGIAACLSKPVSRDALLRLVQDVPSAGGAALAAPVASPAPTAPVLDKAQLAALIDGADRSVIAPLLQRFLTETDAAIPALCAPDLAGPDLAARAHKLAGSCGTFGLMALRAALTGIETRIQNGDPRPKDALDDLPVLWAKARAALQQAWQDSEAA